MSKPTSHPTSTPRIWFTGDTHFGHENIIHYTERPFANAKEMDAALIANWNAVVGTKDHVYHLGDVAHGPRSKDIIYLQRIIRKLNGVKHLVLGNHDHQRPAWYNEAGFDSVHYPYLTVEEFDLTHNPHEWDVGDSEAVFLCAHVHTSWKWRGQAINVGVDQWGYAPVSIETIREEVAKYLKT